MPQTIENMIQPDIEKYVEQHTSPVNELLQELDRQTHVKMLRPRMLSGGYQGKFLEMISRMIQPKRILEIGTFTGYSAIALAQGLQTDGVLHTIDIDEELEDFTQYFFDKSGLKDKIQFHIGNAMDIIPTFEEQFDLVFIDADKENYLNYYELVFDKVRKGGIILVDNLLWSGKVLFESNYNDIDTKAIVEFNQYVQQDARVENILFPFRDGLMMIEKKGGNAVQDTSKRVDKVQVDK